MGRKPLRLMASVTCRWASPLNEGLGITSCRTSGAERSPGNMGATKKLSEAFGSCIPEIVARLSVLRKWGSDALPMSRTLPFLRRPEPEALQFVLGLALESTIAWRVRGTRTAEPRRCIRATSYVTPNV
jgi:hypothetical protein